MNLKKFEGKLIYHVSDADLDGISARILAEYFLQPITEAYIPYNTYDRDLPEFDWNLANEAHYIIFTDLHPPADIYPKLEERHKKGEVLIFDHHMTSRDELPESEFFYWTDEKCGTKIFYEFLTEGKRTKPIIKQYIDLVDTYDRFLTETDLWPEAKGLHNIMYENIDWSKAKWQTETEKHIKFILSVLYKFQNSKDFYFTKQEEAYIINANNKEQKNYKQAKKSLQIREDDEGKKYAYIACLSKLSFVAHRILGELDSKIDYLVARSTYKKDSLKVSIRSRNGYDCAKLAEKWGGGGHSAASAMSFDTMENLEKFQKGTLHLT